MAVTVRFSLAFVLLAVASGFAHAQDAKQAHALAEINRDVWEPFIDGVGSYRHEQYAEVRAKDSIFVDGKRLFSYAAYVEDALRVMAPLQAAGSTIAMEVRFEERVSDGVHASERGIMRSSLTDAKGNVRTGYSRFHAIHRKQADGWRIVTEYRWRTTPEADAAAFAQAQPLGAADRSP